MRHPTPHPFASPARRRPGHRFALAGIALGLGAAALPLLGRALDLASDGGLALVLLAPSAALAAAGVVFALVLGRIERRSGAGDA